MDNQNNFNINNEQNNSNNNNNNVTNQQTTNLPGVEISNINTITNGNQP